MDQANIVLGNMETKTYKQLYNSQNLKPNMKDHAYTLLEDVILVIYD